MNIVLLLFVLIFALLLLRTEVKSLWQTQHMPSAMPLDFSALVVALLCAFGIISQGLLTTRSLAMASLAVNDANQNVSPVINWLSRLTNMVIVLMAISRVLVAGFREGVGASRRISIRIGDFAWVAVAFSAMYFLPAIAAEEPVFDQKAAYILLALLLIDFSNREFALSAARLLKRMLAVFLLLSIAFIAIDQDRVLAPRYHGVLPGFDYRFWGLAPHANAIGPTAALLVLLEVAVPSVWRSERWVIMLAGFFALLLSQSKTSILGLVIGLYVSWVFRSSGRSRGAKVGLHRGVISLYFLALLVSFVTLSALLFGYTERAEGLLARLSDKLNLDDFSGRAIIWKAAISEFARNPISGYGLSIWDDQYRQKIGLNFAYHAHNQVLQTASESGVIGLLGLLVLILYCAIKSYRSIPGTNGASVGLLSVFLLRFATEAPLKLQAIGSIEVAFLISFALLWRLRIDAD